MAIDIFVFSSVTVKWWRFFVLKNLKIEDLADISWRLGIALGTILFEL